MAFRLPGMTSRRASSRRTVLLFPKPVSAAVIPTMRVAAGDDAARAMTAGDPRVRCVRPEGARDWNELLKLRTR